MGFEQLTLELRLVRRIAYGGVRVRVGVRVGVRVRVRVGVRVRVRVRVRVVWLGVCVRGFALVACCILHAPGP